MKDLKNKVVVITGVGSGMGKELSLQMAQHGARLAVMDFNEASLDDTVSLIKSYHAEVYASCFDVSNREDFYRFGEGVIQHFGEVDVVINNAGVALGGISIEKLDYRDFEWVMGINFWGMVYGTKIFLPYIKKQNEGSIVNISSIFGIMGVSEQGAYCSSKFAIRGFTESLRMELMQEAPHVIASVVHPGGVKTNIARDSKDALGDFVDKNNLDEIEKLFITTASDAAKTIIKGIQNKQARILIGSDARKNDWIVRLMPAKYSKLILRYFLSKGLGT